MISWSSGSELRSVSPEQMFLRPSRSRGASMLRAAALTMLPSVGSSSAKASPKASEKAACRAPTLSKPLSNSP